MKVSLPILQRVYEALQDQGSGDHTETELLDPESHLFVVDAFEMPVWNWSHERGTFEKCVLHHLLFSIVLKSEGLQYHQQCLVQQNHA